MRLELHVRRAIRAEQSEGGEEEAPKAKRKAVVCCF